MSGLSKDLAEKAEANRRHQAAWRERHKLVIHDLRMKQEDLRRASLLIAKMGNMSLANRLSRAADEIGEL